MFPIGKKYRAQRGWWLLTLCSLTIAFSAHGQPKNAQTTTSLVQSLQPPKPHLAVKTLVLQNGLHIIVVSKQDSLAIEAHISYPFSSKSNYRSSLKGMDIVPQLSIERSRYRGENQRQLLAGRGGSLVAQVQSSRYTFTYAVPANELPMVFWSEKQRMKQPTLSQNQLARLFPRLVADQQRTWEQSPTAFLFSILAEQPNALPFLSESKPHFPSPKLDALNLHASATFVPNNAVLSVVGNVDADHVFELAHRFFDPLPSAPSAPRKAKPSSKAKAARCYVLRLKTQKKQKLIYRWDLPVLDARTRFGMQWLAAWVCSEQSPLTQAYRKQFPTYPSPTCSLHHELGTPGWVLATDLPESQELVSVQTLIQEQIQKMSQSTWTAAELSLARVEVLQTLVDHHHRPSWLVQALTDYEQRGKGARSILFENQIFATLNPTVVQQLLQTHLVPTFTPMIVINHR
jgi:zinc protease